ncbi:MAG: c-type cytochrome [Gammaproteobacteria bacterium]|nr:c-type cytochrome [Gammaproteobacteria bacterium]
MKKFLRYLAWSVAAIVVLAVGASFVLARMAASRYETEWTVHNADFPIPFPLAGNELAASTQPEADALEAAIRRGQHLVDSRVGCKGCHGGDLGGAAIVDVALVGHWIAPNLTAGAGSVVEGYTANDWDRAVRHGVRRNGQTSSMPSQDFLNLSDHELSDIVTYIRSMPAVDRDLGPVRFGPVFNYLVATDPNLMIAFKLDHNKPHAVEPPSAAPGAELGAHIAQVCSGCHGANFSGGKLAGDPNMPIVANLTPHESGLRDWTEEDFIRALREGKRKDGTDISPMMPWRAYAQMTDTEIRALWAYLETIPAVEKGAR